MVSVVSELVVILFGLQNVSGRFIVLVLMCLARSVYYCVEMYLSL